MKNSEMARKRRIEREQVQDRGRESFCVVGVPPHAIDDVVGIPTIGAWTDPESGARHLDNGQLIHHSVMDYDAVSNLARRLGEKSFISVDIHGAAHLVWADGRKPVLLGQWREVSLVELGTRADYTSLYDDDAGYQRFFVAGGAL